jgi:hypothetical protein
MMAEERIEEHEHVVSETDEGRSESHSDKVVEKEKGGGGHGVTIEEETTVEKND